MSATIIASLSQAYTASVQYIQAHPEVLEWALLITLWCGAYFILMQITAFTCRLFSKKAGKQTNNQRPPRPVQKVGDPKVTSTLVTVVTELEKAADKPKLNRHATQKRHPRDEARTTLSMLPKLLLTKEELSKSAEDLVKTLVSAKFNRDASKSNPDKPYLLDIYNTLGLNESQGPRPKATKPKLAEIIAEEVCMLVDCAGGAAAFMQWLRKKA